MSAPAAEPLYEEFALPLDCGQPCGFDCAFARVVRTDAWTDEWIWCSHPARTTRLVHPGRSCPRYAARDALTADDSFLR